MMGGKFSHRKPKWYLLEFIYNSSGRWKLENNDSDITVTTNNKKDTIERVPPSQASQITGVRI